MDGVVGVVTHRVPRAVVLEAKQRHVRALIPLERLVDATAPDHRLIQEAATETHVLVRMMHIRFSIKGKQKLSFYEKLQLFYFFSRWWME